MDLAFRVSGLAFGDVYGLRRLAGFGLGIWALEGGGFGFEVQSFSASRCVLCGLRVGDGL